MTDPATRIGAESSKGVIVMTGAASTAAFTRTMRWREAKNSSCSRNSELHSDSRSACSAPTGVRNPSCACSAAPYRTRGTSSNAVTALRMFIDASPALNRPVITSPVSRLAKSAVATGTSRSSPPTRGRRSAPIRVRGDGASIRSPGSADGRFLTDSVEKTQNTFLPTTCCTVF